MAGAQLLQVEDDLGARRDVGAQDASGKGALRVVAPDSDSKLSTVLDRLSDVLNALQSILKTNDLDLSPDGKLYVIASSDPSTVQHVDDNGGSLTVDDGGASLTVDGTVAVSNLPATQTVDGEVSVSNFPAVQPVSDNGGSLTVDGTVAVSNLPATQTVSGTVSVDNLPATQTVDGTVNVGNLPAVQTVDGAVSISGTPAVSDAYATGEVLADQDGAGAALTFTFTEEMDLVWIRCDGGDGRADPFGGTPTASLGIVCEDGIPNPLTVRATSVQVYAEAGTTVHVWGFRY